MLMARSRRHWLSAVTAVAASGVWRPSLAQAGIEYRQRGNRAEGVRALPVSGYLIELVSFRARYDEQSTPAPLSPYRLRFFLDRDAPAYVVVREQENRYSYWLDKVRPASPWRTGFGNVFEWSSQEVLAQLSELRPDQLGVTVRLGGDSPSSVERVAPAILYRTTAPTAITAYEVTFVSNVSIRFTASVEREDGAAAIGAVEPPSLRSWPPGLPLRLSWDASLAAAGRYRLRLRAQSRENLERFDQVVEFFHQPQVR